MSHTRSPFLYVHQPSVSLQSCCRGPRLHDRARLSAGFPSRSRCRTERQFEAHPATPAAPGAQDLRSLLWSSIDNDTSKDLDQIEWAEQLPDGRIRVLVGVADVDARVSKGTVLDGHAQSETTSVYTGVKVFPMLPAELSEGITSLNENEDRVAVVIEYAVDASGTASDGKAYRALVRNRAQLAYNSVGAWLEGRGPAPAKVAASADLAAQLKLQDTAAQRMVRWALPARGARSGNHRNPACDAEGRCRRDRETGKESRHVAHRGVHGGGQRRHRAYLRAGRRGQHPTHRAHAQALGPYCRGGRGPGHHATRGT
jgi:hypothetical protein